MYLVEKLPTACWCLGWKVGSSVQGYICQLLYPLDQMTQEGLYRCTVPKIIYFITIEICRPTDPPLETHTWSYFVIFNQKLIYLGNKCFKYWFISIFCILYKLNIKMSWWLCIDNRECMISFQWRRKRLDIFCSSLLISKT